MDLKNISSQTGKLGIIGWPLAHTASPRLHNAAFSALGLDFLYLCLPVEPDNIAAAANALKALSFTGANVTIPHKVSIMPFLDSLSESAQMAGAVNTIVIKDGKSIGYNTDLDGFAHSLLKENVEISGKKTVVLGAGGACRAVVAAFLKYGAQSAAILARDAHKAKETAALFPSFSKTPVTGTAWNAADCLKIWQEADLVVNTTPLGMMPDCDAAPPVAWDELKRGAVLADVIYTPRLTKFLKCAQERGHKTIGGEGMLLGQAMAAFKLWTGQDAPAEVMLNALQGGS
ncbi:MAG: shikimate dehydrogenase [Sporomusaceae bacterium]|jgi:shikimate dehydrogenase|nr:shikimate dehydrogenase [Sporomusaceae bacterium]